MIRLRTPSIRYETGFAVATVAEPVDLDQVPRDVHRGDEEEDEEEREEALDRLAGAGAQRGEGAERAEARATTTNEKHEEDERAGDARLERTPATMPTAR